MVFIHGGGFKLGSGNDDDYGPDFLVEQDIVLVTINYRLDVLGFLCLDTIDVPGNAGMKDQVAALRWVKNNIEHFGGDPRNITVFGESAGGASTSLHVISPLADGLFNRALTMSGTAFSEWAMTERPVERAFALGRKLGIHTEDPIELQKFLQNLPVEKLVNVQISLNSYEVKTNYMWKVNQFGPTVEKRLGQDAFLLEDPLDLLQKGAGKDIDVMIGYTNEEGILGISTFAKTWVESFSNTPDLFLPARIATKSTPDKVLVLSQRYFDRYFGDKDLNEHGVRGIVTYMTEKAIYPIKKYINHLSKSSKSKRYFYRFCCLSERNIYGIPGQQYGIAGASHLDDMMYLFDPKKISLKLDTNSKTFAMIKLSCTVFTNFAKFG